MQYMHRALRLAKQAYRQDEVPVGAILVKDHHVISQTHNRCVIDNNPLYHAEMLAIYQGISQLQTLYLNECTLYVTLEPCPMCAAAIAQARVGKLIFGAYDHKSGGVEHGPKIFSHAHHTPEIIGGVLEDECASLLRNFFKKKR